MFGASCPVADAGTDGMILYPMSRYLLYIKNKKLHSDPQWEFADIHEAVINSVRVHSGDWNPSLGTYRAPAETKDCYRDSQGTPMWDTPELPANLASAMGRVHANLYAAQSGSPED